jgi:hypothetical protein
VEQQVVEVTLPNGATALVRALNEGGVPEGATKVGWKELNFDDVAHTLEGLALALRAAVDKASPHKVTVELGLELAVQPGKLIALLVEGAAKGALKVTLEWGRDDPA